MFRARTWLQSFPVERLPLLIGGAAFIFVLDWAIKYSQPLLWGGWVPHLAERPLILFPILVLGYVSIIWMVQSTMATIACAVALGGITANLVDLKLNGFVWNMFPLPGTAVWFNLADVCIIGGTMVALFCAFRMVFELWPTS